MASYLRQLRNVVASKRHISHSKFSFLRNFTNVCISEAKTEETSIQASRRGLVLGVYSDEENKLDAGLLTPVAWRYNNLFTNGKLLENLRVAGPMPKRGECRILYNLEPNFSAIAVCGLGKESLGYDSYEELDEGKEAIRTAAAVGCSALQNLNMKKILVENFGHAESAGEGSLLGVWTYQELKNRSDQMLIPKVEQFEEVDKECDWNAWNIGITKASAQNLARQFQETPANILTPTCFAQKIVEILCQSGVNVEVKVKSWAESQQMNSFLAVAKGSCEPPIFVELSYYGSNAEEPPVVLVGQGVTYDTGGLSLKNAGDLKNMRGDMSGAACVVAACQAMARLKVPINIRGLIPLCENAIGCNSFKPGDIAKSMCGKTIQMKRTDYKDTLVLIDALVYAQHFFPRFTIDIGHTSKENEMHDALGQAATGVFTNSEELWWQMKNASIHTGDRVWRFPLWKYYTDRVTSLEEADVCNVGVGEGGGACSAAAILNEFVTCGQWMHIDSTSVMTTNGNDYEYLRRGMAGRPTRTLIEFLIQLACKGVKQSNNKEAQV